MPDGVGLGKIWAAIDLDISGLTVGIDRAKREIATMGATLTGSIGKNQEQLRSSLTQLGTVMAGAGAAIAGGLALGANEAKKFEKEMRNVNSISGLSEKSLSGLSESVKKMAMDIGKAPEDLASGLYDIASSGFQGAAGLQVLKESAKGAKAGVSDTATSAKGLTAVLNAYGLSANDSQRIMDIMFRTVDRGVITFSEFAGSIGGVISTAAAAGIGFEEVGAAIATLTKAGNPAEEAITALNNTINQIISPSKDAMKIAAQLGLDWLAAGKGAQELRRVGLAGVMDDIRKATGGNIEVIARMMPELRALKGTLGMTRQEGSAFASDMAAMRNALGATDSALAQQNKSWENMIEQMTASIKVIAGDLGNAFLPALKDATKWITDMAKSFAGLSPETQKFIAYSAAITAALLSLGGAILMIGPQVGTMIAGFTMAGISIGSLAGPVGIVIGVLAALGVAIYGVVKGIQYLNRDQVAEARTAAESARKKAEQAKETKNLVAEYDRLQNKTNRTAEETSKMRDILQRISEINPDLVKGYDAQGRPLALLANAYAKAADEAARLEENAVRAAHSANLKTRVQNDEQIANLQENIKARNKQRNSGIKKEYPSFMMGVGGTYTPYNVSLSKSDVTEINKQNKEDRDTIAQLQQQNKDLLEEGKQLARGKWPTASKPSSKSTGAGGSGSGSGVSLGGSKSKPTGPTAAERAVMAQENVVQGLSQNYDESANRLGRLLNAGDLAQAKAELAQMNDLTIKLVSASQKVGELKKKTEKTPEGKQKVSLETSGANNRYAQQYMTAKEQIASKEKELGDKSKAQSEKIKAYKEKLAADELSVTAANEQAQIDLLRASGNEKAAVQAETNTRIKSLIASGVDDITAFRVAYTEENQKLKELEERKADESLSVDLKKLNYQLAHNKISTDDYIQHLQKRLQAETQFSERWYTIQDAIESAYADQAERKIDAAERVANTNKEKALEMLYADLAAYTAMGDAGVEAMERIQEAIDKLEKKNNKVAKESSGIWHDFMHEMGESFKDVLANIRSSFSSALADLIMGIGSLRDFWKRTLHAILETLINILIQMLIRWATAKKGMVDGLSSLISESTNSMLGDLNKVAGAIAGIAALGSKKKRKGGILGGVLGLGLSFIPGLNIAATLGTFLTGAGIGGALFDNPLNDTGAVRLGASLARSNADFNRLFNQGFGAEIGRVFPRGITTEPAGSSKGDVNHNETINVNTKIDKVTNIDDINKISEAQAWVIQKRLGLA